jgi:inorganic pyrophosphatase
MELTKNKFKAHPWHGVSVGNESPHKVTAYIEIIPTDVVKYEIDKESGYLRIDRPQKYSNYCPALYGFIPQTYCGKHVGLNCSEKTGRVVSFGDRDPIDICVLTEKAIQHGDILVKAIPIGGFRLIDKDEADDKIIAVLDQDGVYGRFRDIEECPKSLIDSLRHYFLTYKEIPGEASGKIEIAETYGAKVAQEVIKLSQLDYEETFNIG